MIDDISPAAERAIESARSIDTPGKLDAVRLFLALTEDDESRSATVLMQAGGDLPRIRHAVSARSAHPCELAQVLKAAHDAAGQRSELTVTGEFLLLGLIRIDQMLMEAAAEHGVDPARLFGSAVDLPIALDSPIHPADPVETLSTVRILDVNANRARESLRILDDYFRFVLNDAVLTELAKGIRHRLTDALDKLPDRLAIDARDTPGDVGTSLTAAGEYVRHGPAETARVNLKRLQESLRSLEEYGKVIDVEFAQAVERIRYESYALDRSAAIGADARRRFDNLRLYLLVSGASCRASIEWTIQEAVDGGVDIVQLREKNLPDRELVERARAVRRWTRRSGAMFIVNDRPDIARLVEADGVHLGQDDLSVADARRVLGSGPLIGVSTHDADQIRTAVRDGADYIGIGPTFPSGTKEFTHFPGLEFIRSATELTTLPSFAIGGISPSNVSAVVAVGATRIAVGQAVTQADDPRIAAVTLKSALVGK